MKKFYLRNYKSIHHLLSFLMFILLSFSSGFNELSDMNLPYLFMILVINYYITKFCLWVSGLEEEAEKQLKEIEEE
jgi:hypothetical protein